MLTICAASVAMLLETHLQDPLDELAACWFRVFSRRPATGRVRVVVKSLRSRMIGAFENPFGYYVPDARQRITFEARTRKGKYEWLLSATDWAGNVQKTSWKYLTVK